MKKNNLNNLIIMILVFMIMVVAFISPKKAVAAENKSKVYCQLCEHKNDNDPLYNKERQFYQKIQIIKKVFGDSIDEVALAAAVLHRYNSKELAYEREYDKDFNENNYEDSWKQAKSTDGAIGSDGKIGITEDDKKRIESNEQLDLITTAAIVMVDSNHFGKYSDVCFKDGLAGDGLVGNNSNSGAFVTFYNAIFCGAYESFNVITTPIDFITRFFSGDNIFVSAESAKRKLVNIKNVCENGYVGGLYTGVDKIKDEERKKRAKELYAQQIIDFANYYKMLYGTLDNNNSCSSNIAGATGDYSKWRQYDETWGGISLGGSSATMKSAGCLVTSVAIQIARSQTQIASLPSGYSEFNPGAFVTQLNNNGGLDGGGNFYWSDNGYASLAPNWHHGYSVNLSTSDNATLAKAISDELSTPYDGKYQKFIILFIWHGSYPSHYVAVNGVENGVVTIFDPAGDGSTLDENYSSWGAQGYDVYYASDVNFGSSGSGVSSSGSNICSTADSNASGLLSFISYIEGVPSCNYRGQGEGTGYASTYLNDGNGYTAAYGITHYFDWVAQEVGYTDFIADKDGPHCNSKEYMDKMAPRVLDSFATSHVDAYAETKGVTLTGAQRDALTSVAYGGGAFEQDIIDALASNNDSNSDAVLKAFKGSYNPAPEYRYGLGVRRMAEYEVFVTGNYNASKPYDLFGSDSEIQAASKDLVQSRWPSQRDIFVWDGTVSSVSSSSSSGKVCKNGKAVSEDSTDGASSVPVVCAGKDKTTRVLFVGNSRTGEQNNIPEKFEGIAKANGYSVNVTRAVKNGYTLNELNSYFDGVLNNSYDCVLIQEQTETYIDNYNTFLSGTRSVVNKVKNANPNVKVYIRQTWGHTWTSSNGVNRSETNKAYSNAQKVADETESYVVSDGKAFEKSMSDNPSIHVFANDDRHQSDPEGAYLSAACIYNVLFGETSFGSSYNGGMNNTVAESLQKSADLVCKSPRTSLSGMGQAVVDLALQQLPETGAKFWNYIFGGGFYNGSATPWCACFVTWTLDHTTYNNTPVKNIIDVRAGGKSGAGAGGYLEYASEHGMLKYNDSCSMYSGKNGNSYTPKAGDLVIFSWDADWDGVASSNAPGHDHIGIVEKAENGVLYTIEGNSSNAVRQKTYSLSNCQVSAFISWEK